MVLEPLRESRWSRWRAAARRFWPAVVGLGALAAAIAVQVIPFVLTHWTASPLPLVSLRVEPAIIEEGGTVKVTWTVRNVQTLLIEPFGALTPVDGSRTVQLRETTEFRAFASAANGQFSDQRTVTVRTPKASVPVQPPPRPKSTERAAPPAAVPTPPSAPRNPRPADSAPVESRTFNLAWGCEETTSSTVRQPVANNGAMHWSARWDLPTVLNVKTYELTPPTFDASTRTITGAYRFVGSDRLLSGGCPQGQATLVLTWAPLLPPAAPGAVRVQ
jgi:hypothetical protein